jgi:hypothetical protein
MQLKEKHYLQRDNETREEANKRIDKMVYKFEYTMAQETTILRITENDCRLLIEKICNDVRYPIIPISFLYNIPQFDWTDYCKQNFMDRKGKPTATMWTHADNSREITVYKDTACNPVTIIHELTHYVQRKLYGEKSLSHGREFMTIYLSMLKEYCDIDWIEGAKMRGLV